MKKIFFTIAALTVMSASVFAKGEPSKDPGAPTGFPDIRKSTPIRVMYDDDDAYVAAGKDPQYLKDVTKEGDVVIEGVHTREYYINYFKYTGGAERKMLNLNYGSNIALPPLHGAIR